MSANQLRELAPHYVVMFVLVFGAIGLIRLTVGELDFWAEVVIIFAVVFAYRPIVVMLGVAPSRWEPEE